MVVLYTSVSDIYILHGDPKKWSGKELLVGDVLRVGDGCRLRGFFGFYMV